MQLASETLTVNTLKVINREHIVDASFNGDDFEVLPCKGIYKLSKSNEPINFTYCQSEYWKCPNTNCIMKLV